MKRHTWALFIWLLAAFPLFAAKSDPCVLIDNLVATDTLVNEVVNVSWTFPGEIPTSIVVTGSEIPNPLPLPEGLDAFSFSSRSPGEKHLTLTATGSCGTDIVATKYHVKQCTIDTPVITVDKTTVLPGETLHASVELAPPHTAQWTVYNNGQEQTGSGPSIDIVAAAFGTIDINVRVYRAASCSIGANAVVQIDRPECVVQPFNLQVPETGVAGYFVFPWIERFPEENEFTVWSAVNGQVLYGDDFGAVIQADFGATSLEVTAQRIKNFGECELTETKTIPLTECGASATITNVQPTGCSGATITAELTGTPPFQGLWSDYVWFETNESTITREVTQPGVYSLLYFYDSTFCSGRTSGEAVVSPSQNQGTASFTVSCGKMIVSLTGEAPYTFTVHQSWDQQFSETITTNQPVYEYALTHTDPYGYVSISDFTSGGCPGAILTGSEFVYGPPSVLIVPQFSCTPYTTGGWITVYVNNSTEPFTVTWSDGYTQQAYYNAQRYVDPFVQATYTVTSVETSCGPAQLPENTSFTFFPNPTPIVQIDGFGGGVCPGGTGSATLSQPLPDYATIVWSVQNGTITSGQGTNHIEYIAGAPGSLAVTATAQYPDGCSVTSSPIYSTQHVYGDPQVSLQLESTTIQAGESTLLTVYVQDADGFGIQTSLGDLLEQVDWSPGQVVFRYNSTNGPGESVITISGNGYCGQSFEVSTTLTILP